MSQSLEPITSMSTPSVTEWKITAGIWSFGLLIFSAALKLARPVLSVSIGGGQTENAS